jgi:hypothetical protein
MRRSTFRRPAFLGRVPEFAAGSRATGRASARGGFRRDLGLVVSAPSRFLLDRDLPMTSLTDFCISAASRFCRSHPIRPSSAQMPDDGGTRVQKKSTGRAYDQLTHPPISKLAAAPPPYWGSAQRLDAWISRPSLDHRRARKKILVRSMCYKADQCHSSDTTQCRSSDTGLSKNSARLSRI